MKDDDAVPAGSEPVGTSWQDVRAKRAPREDRVAEYRAQLDAAVRAHQLREVRTVRD